MSTCIASLGVFAAVLTWIAWRSYRRERQRLERNLSDLEYLFEETLLEGE